MSKNGGEQRRERVQPRGPKRREKNHEKVRVLREIFIKVRVTHHEYVAHITP